VRPKVSPYDGLTMVDVLAPFAGSMVVAFCSVLPLAAAISSLASQLDKLVNRVLVPSLCLLPQRH
jgi:hypothetical protein